jgi:glyoxylase-like metal-dependent hydrolase (beta-lactamase superfamily II)
MGRTERDYWIDPTRSTPSARRARVSPRAQAGGSTPSTDMLETFEDGAEVAPGVTAVATAGHTPGHMSFAISSGGTTSW